MSGPNKGTAVYRRAKAKGYDVYPRQHVGTDDEEKEERSHKWAATSRMFFDESAARTEKAIGDLPSKRASNVKVGKLK